MKVDKSNVDVKVDIPCLVARLQIWATDFPGDPIHLSVFISDGIVYNVP